MSVGSCVSVCTAMVMWLLWQQVLHETWNEIKAWWECESGALHGCKAQVAIQETN